MAEYCCQEQCDDTEHDHRVRRFLQTVVHRCNILANIDRLHGAVIIYDRFGRHHDARHLFSLILPAEYRDLPLPCLPVAHNIEDERLDMERGPREIRQPSILVEDIEKQPVIRALVTAIL